MAPGNLRTDPLMSVSESEEPLVTRQNIGPRQADGGYVGEQAGDIGGGLQRAEGPSESELWAGETEFQDRSGHRRGLDFEHPDGGCVRGIKYVQAQLGASDGWKIKPRRLADRSAVGDGLPDTPVPIIQGERLDVRGILIDDDPRKSGGLGKINFQPAVRRAGGIGSPAGIRVGVHGQSGAVVGGVILPDGTRGNRLALGKVDQKRLTGGQA